jgi:hypothetical protein
MSRLLPQQHQCNSATDITISISSDEARLVIVIKAIQGPTQLSIRSASRIYNVKRSTLQDRLSERCIQRDTQANSKILTQLEEQSIVEYVLDLTTRSFPPRLSSIEDITNQLLASRNDKQIGKH